MLQENHGSVSYLDHVALARLGAADGVVVLPPLDTLHRFTESVVHLANHHVDTAAVFVTHREGTSMNACIASHG